MPVRRKKKPNVIQRPPQQLVDAPPALPPGLVDRKPGGMVNRGALPSSSGAASSTAMPEDNLDDLSKVFEDAVTAYLMGIDNEEDEELTSAISMPGDTETRDSEVDSHSWPGWLNVVSPGGWWTSVGADARSYLGHVGESLLIVAQECLEDLVEEVNRSLIGSDDELPSVLATNSLGMGWVVGALCTTGAICQYLNIALPNVATVSLGAGCAVWGIASLGFIYVQRSTLQALTAPQNYSQIIEHQILVLGIYCCVGWVPIVSTFGFLTDLFKLAKFVVLVDCGLLVYLSCQHARLVWEIIVCSGRKRSDTQMCRLSTHVCFISNCFWTLLLSAIYP